MDVDSPAITTTTSAAGPAPQPFWHPSDPIAASPGKLRLPLSGYVDRVGGCLLGKMCGDVLGAGVEGWAHQDVQLSNPEGLTDFLHTERGFGCYTDDTQMAIALARSLVACGGRVDDVHAARCYVQEYQQFRGYGATAYKIMSTIQRCGIDSESIRTIGTTYIPDGSFGNGGAMRIAPLGLVYRHAPPEVLRKAVAAALRCTHVHPVAVDGAFVIALGIAYLVEREPPAGAAAADYAPAGAAAADYAPAGAAAVAASGSGDSEPQVTSTEAMAAAGNVVHDARDGVVLPKAEAEESVAAASTAPPKKVATPLGLLDYLLSHSSLLETEGMVQKLKTVQTALVQAPHQFKGPNETWSQYFASPRWAEELRLQAEVSEPFQIRADDAAAAALSALCCHWGQPEDAVVAAVHYGGDTDTVAAITGALVGALHGTRWLPTRWYDNLENGASGRDEVLQLAIKLAEYDIRT
ncbi:hypothetical protein VOLCADRAFT_127347 [Volvox carteri f. nagariensis]|uniref:ADP-ribosylhydrolase ARH3 n=1 Tax=Volvox carteri f. nagariensis TaxID=3068 RepID=D8THN6_VOLCA|nr:uncharacterized protein VOLCADRAFT_127347 [Volvox carteri f. nagariensis]EFJ53098.1 hypothetical protein VOLCADRAFT_127347 [Volvox carteri f. nagariensis]|eukprot:XP_002946103.1 hypothetical protein VOLCADRAFT_127347 [Volvox carteri f. nagariensis]